MRRTTPHATSARPSLLGRTLIGLILPGLTLLAAQRGAAQTYPVASPLPVNAPCVEAPCVDSLYFQSRPYYVSEAINGNEAYPKVVAADAIDLGPITADAKASPGHDGCHECCHACCACPPSADWRTAATCFLRRCLRAVACHGP